MGTTETELAARGTHALYGDLYPGRKSGSQQQRLGCDARSQSPEKMTSRTRPRPCSSNNTHTIVSTSSSSSLSSSIMRLLLVVLAYLSVTVQGQVGDYTSSSCAVEKEAYANCVFRLEPASVGKSCDDCRISTFETMPDPELLSCDELEGTLCTAVHSCGCETCKDELESFWNCTALNTINATCSIDCFTEESATPTGPLCPSDFASYKTCVLGLDTTISAVCDDCRLQASSRIPPDVDDCIVVNDIFCQALESCPCAQCTQSLESYLNCDVSKRWFGECNVQCGIDYIDGMTADVYNENPEAAQNALASELNGENNQNFIIGAVKSDATRRSRTGYVPLLFAVMGLGWSIL